MRLSPALMPPGSRFLRLAVVYALLLFGCATTHHHPSGPQEADLTASVSIEKPTYSENGPRVLFDEAHENFHTPSGRYAPFAKLMEADGFRVTSSSVILSERNLKGVAIVVIANPAAPLAGAEMDAVSRWVRAGGSLLLVSDHPPFATSAGLLAARFGTDTSNGWTSDAAQAEPGAPRPSWVRYTRESGGLGEHPITRGLDVVVTFTGQSLGTKAGRALLRLSDDAQDHASREALESGAQGRPAAGRAQAVALRHGAGRVVITGEAAMLTAQQIDDQRFGFTRSGTDNRQFALNIVRWLSGALQ